MLTRTCKSSFAWQDMLLAEGSKRDISSSKLCYVFDSVKGAEAGQGFLSRTSGTLMTGTATAHSEI